MSNSDPIITPLLITAFPTLGTVIFGTVTYATVLSSIIVTGTLIGLQLALAPKQRPEPKPSDGSFAVRSPIPERIYGVGDVRLGGKILFMEEKDNHLHSVQALCDGEVERLAFYLHDDVVGTDAFNLVGPTADGKYQAGGIKQARLELKFGEAGVEAFPLLSAFFPGHVPTTFSGTGMTMIHAQFAAPPQEQFQACYPNGRPEPSCVVRFKGRFDPRDSAQDPNDPLTWSASSKNLAINWLWFECFCENGPKRNYATAILPYIDIWKEAINACDDPMPVKGGGTVPRYQIGYWWDAATSEDSVRAMFIACSDGWCSHLPGGGFIVRVGKFVEPTVTITDEMLVGAYIQRDQPVEDRVNELILKYSSPEHDYGEIEADPFRDDAQVIADGRLLNATIDLWGVQHLNQARRLGHIEWNRQNEGLRGRLDLNLLGLSAIGHRWLRVQSAMLPRLADEVIEARGGALEAVDGGVAIDFVRSGAFMYEHDPNAAVFGDGDDPTVPVRPVSNFLTAPEDVQGVYVDLGIAAGARLDVNWDEPATSGQTYEIRYRTFSPMGDWIVQPVSSPVIAGGRIAFSVLPIPPVADLYDVQVSAIAPGGSRSDWQPAPPLVLGLGFGFLMPQGAVVAGVGNVS